MVTKKTMQSNVSERKCILLLVCLSLLLISGCAGRHKIVTIRAEQYKVYSYQNSDNRAKVTLLKKHFSKWRGTKYRDGGMSHSGIDCSGFSVVTYRDLFGIKLPRTTTKQAEKGRAVSKRGLRAGDLVFF
jgi:probable lipoprotein NlpC